MEMVSANFRPLTTAFTPSLWADVFNTFSFDDQLQNKYGENIEALKKDVTNMLMAATSSKLIVLVDKLERLGLAYHFETEIEEKLQQIHNSGNNEDYDLLTTALGFRLLRQHQYHVSCNVFEKFVEEDKKLKESLCNDVEGLLSFYEAAHVRIHGENILDEAMEFTVEHLNRMVPELKSPTKEKVQQALQLSIHRGVPILTVRFYISIYESTDDDQLLVKLAKFNFNFLQNVYKKELSELSRWWNKFELKSKLPFVRDRVVECYLLGTTYGFEPQYAYVRRDVAKSLLMVTVMDDMYDNYATLEEAQLFTHILDRGVAHIILLITCCGLLCCLIRKRKMAKEGGGGEAARGADEAEKGVPPSTGEVEVSGGEMGGKLVHFDGSMVFSADDLLCATAETMAELACFRHVCGELACFRRAWRRTRRGSHHQ